MPRSRRLGITAWSLAALVAGFGLGALGHATDSALLAGLGRAVRPLGALWLAALQMTVLPLVLAHLLAAIVAGRDGGSVGALGARAIALFVALLVVAGLFTLAVTPPIVERYAVDPGTVAALDRTATIPDELRETAADRDTLGEWVAGLLPANLLAAALAGEILPLLFFTVLLGLAITRLPDEQRIPLTRAIRGLAAAMLTLVGWILVLTPLGVFALIYALALGSGGVGAGMLGAFVVIQSGLMLLFTVVLYPLTALLGRARIADFARAVAPAQLVAVSTRSSIAALPALVQGARERLRLPPTATGFVLPLGVSVFKVNRTISAPVKLLFLAHVYGIPLDAGTLATFLVTVIVLSFSSVGIPGGGSTFKTMPAYLAAGMPIEGIVILEAVDAIPDIFKTLVNVTGDMSAATILAGTERRALAPADGDAPFAVPDAA